MYVYDSEVVLVQRFSIKFGTGNNCGNLYVKMSMLLPEFNYCDVSQENQIRLMRIDKITEDNTIECTLTPPIDRDRTPPYFALS